MSLRDILIILDGTSRTAVRVELAVELARRSDAYLTGLCPLELLLPPDLSLIYGAYPDMLAVQAEADRIYAQGRERAAPIEAEFRQRLRRNAINGNYQSEPGPVGAVVLQRARTADLVIIGQADPEAGLPASARGLLEDVLLGSGRPVLAIPYAGQFNTLGSNVLIAWTNTRESSRAVHDALPLIQPDGAVTVLTVERPRDVEADEIVPNADITAHLARHGLKSSAARTVIDRSISEADAILSYAADMSADLLIAGCYGHSRTRELVLGGVTRGLLQHMTVPVLMSH